jgi:hypothetical protein
MEKTIIIDEGSWVDLPKDSIQDILYAKYGQDNALQGLGGWFNPLGGGPIGFNQMVDVTDIVRNLVSNDRSLHFQVNNHNIGFDPCNGIFKKIEIRYKEYIIPEKVYVEDLEETLPDISPNELYHNGAYAAYIAIDEYQNDNITNLNSCVKDALLLEDTLKKRGFLTLGKIMNNQDATKSGIEGFLDKISQFLKDKNESCFILYIAGHGEKTEVNDHFLCHDYSPDHAISTTIDYDYFNSFSKKFNSKHQLFLVDACYSGSLIKNNERNIKWKNEFLHKRGLHALSSVRNSGKAIESTENGLFTKCFVDILNKSLNDKPFIKISEINGQLEENIKGELNKLNIPNNLNCIHKFGRLYNKIQSRENIHEMIEVDGELIFFKDNILPDNIVTRGGSMHFDWGNYSQ